MSKRTRGLKVVAAPVILAVVAGIAGSGCSEAAKAAGGDCEANITAKVEALQAASEALVSLSGEIRGDVAVACAGIAGMDAPEDPTDEDVETLCAAASAEIDAQFEAAGSVEVIVSPGRCEVNAQAQLNCEADCTVDAECEANVDVTARCSPAELSGSCSAECTGTCQGSAELAVECTGTCEGTCEGMCDGTCEGNASTGGGSSGECEGKCNGTCEGTCRGECAVEAEANVMCEGECKGGCSVEYTEPTCQGELMADASCEVDADCSAGCEGSAKFEAECTPPGVEIVASGSFEGDFQARLTANLPKLIEVGVVRGEAFATLTGEVGEAFVATASAVAELPGCVLAFGAELAAEAQASVEASASVNVSVMASASASGSASSG